MSVENLVGEWKSRYTYDSGSTEHEVVFEKSGKDILIGQGIDNSGSSLILELKYDSNHNVLTGTWRERTSPEGEYKGRIFHGAVQFILQAGLESAEGKWIGFNSDISRVKEGDWTLFRGSELDIDPSLG